MSSLPHVYTEVEAAAREKIREVDWKKLLGGEGSEAAEYLHGVLWNTFMLGWEESKKANGVVTERMENPDYRTGVVVEAGGFIFTHGGTTWLNATTAQGRTQEFSLKTLPEFKSLSEFLDLSADLRIDQEFKSMTEQNTDLFNAVQLICTTIEKCYWVKVADAITRFFDERKLQKDARKALLNAGFKLDDVERMIPIEPIQYD